MKKLALLSVIFSLLSISSALAAIPSVINYQGKLTDASDNPLTGSYNFVFKIYDASTGGTALWSETQNNIVVTNGIFTTMLGSSTTINLAFDNQYWFEVAVNGETLTPRVKMGSIGYAFRAKVAESLTCTGCVSESELDSSIVGVPRGMTFMFTTSCPTGWRRMTEWDDVSILIPDDNYSGSLYASATSVNTLTVTSNTTLTTNEYKGWKLEVVSGTGAGEVYEVSSNTATVITLKSNWVTTPKVWNDLTGAGPSQFKLSNGEDVINLNHGHNNHRHAVGEGSSGGGYWSTCTEYRYEGGTTNVCTHYTWQTMSITGAPMTSFNRGVTDLTAQPDTEISGSGGSTDMKFDNRPRHVNTVYCMKL